MTTTLDHALARVRGARPGPFKHAAVERLLWELKMSLNPKTRPEPRVIVIGLTGDPGAGKDTVAELLTTRGYAAYAFADELRREVAHAWMLQDVAMFTDRAVKELKLSRLALDRCTSGAFVRWAALNGLDLEAPRSPRELLQHWGTYRREQDPDYWVKKLDQLVRQAVAGGQRKFAIKDVRHTNELQWTHAMGGECWRVWRPDAVANRTAHRSCTELLDVTMDRIVHNDSTLAALATDVERVLDLHDAGVLA